MSPGSSRRAGGFSLVLRPTTTGGSFWEFDCFTVQKRSSFGTQSSLRRTFLAGRRRGRLEGRFPPARLLLPGGSQDNWKEFEFTDTEISRIRAAVETWAAFSAAADRQWLQPLVEAL